MLPIIFAFNVLLYSLDNTLNLFHIPLDTTDVLVDWDRTIHELHVSFFLPFSEFLELAEDVVDLVVYDLQTIVQVSELVLLGTDGGSQCVLQILGNIA